MKRKQMKDPRVDDHFEGNDDQLDALKDLLNEYLRLHDFLSDMIEGGELSEVKKSNPADYKRICDTLDKLADCTNPQNDPSAY